MNDRIKQFKDAALGAGYDPKEVESFVSMIPEPKIVQPVASFEPNFSSVDGTFGNYSRGRYSPMGNIGEEKTFQEKVIPTPTPVTQYFANRNPIEKFSKGFNRGTDFGTKENTPLAVPQGKWVVEEAFSGATKKGRIGDSTNRGYGNSVVLRNSLTGEKIRYSHLNQVGVKPGQIVSQGQVVAKSGSTGNSTGPHLDVEYINPQGKLSNILKSPYGSQFI